MDSIKQDLSAGLFERSKRVSPGGVHSPVRAFRNVSTHPRFVHSAKGALITDVDGKNYLDFCMAWGPLIFGHQDEETLAGISEALHRGWSYGTAEPYSLELAELITQSIPWVEKIRFVNSGTEAVMSALRVARAATGRDLILKFDGCYHGHTDSMLVRAGSGLAEMASPDSAGVSSAVAAQTLVAPLDDSKKLAQIFESHGSAIAAVIIEPLPANNGLLPQRKEFIDALFTLAKRHGALVIFDEVISGFRVAFGGMAEVFGVKPDLVTYGKVIGGGFPVGAYGGRADLMNLVAPSGPVYQAGTLSANPIAMTSGLITLKKLKKQPPYLSLQDKTEWLSQELEAIARKKSLLSIRVQRFASVFWPVFGSESSEVIRNPDQIPLNQKKHFATLFQGALERGIYLPPSGVEVGFLSTAHSQADLARFLEVYEAVISQGI